MNIEQHTKEIDYIFGIVKEKLTGSKHKEYANKDNVFINFDDAARLNETANYVQAWNFATKHLVSILGIVKDIQKYTIIAMDEKITDMIAYLILIRNMIVQDKEKAEAA